MGIKSSHVKISHQEGTGCLLGNMTKLAKSLEAWYLDRGSDGYLFIATFLSCTYAL